LFFLKKCFSWKIVFWGGDIKEIKEKEVYRKASVICFSEGNQVRNLRKVEKEITAPDCSGNPFSFFF
jgi:hypothetical protein